MENSRLQRFRINAANLHFEEETIGRVFCILRFEGSQDRAIHKNKQQIMTEQSHLLVSVLSKEKVARFPRH